MNTLMKYYSDNVQRRANRTAVSVPGQGSCSFEELDQASAKVYRFLTEAKIGTEDFVMICLPRSTWTVICMVGVWKAGAAFTVVEDTYAPERIRFIYEDSGCKLKIDMDTMQKILAMEPLSGYKAADPHDAAFAVYTSGTTGNPKGVLHEYGNLVTGVEESMASEREGTAALETDDLDVFGLIAPLNFVASTIAIVDTLIYGTTAVIVPYAIAKDIRKLKDCLIRERITSIFLTATYVRMYDHWSPFLKTVYFGSEPANGLSLDGPELMNVYSLSECGFDICAFRLDRAYDPAPIGKPLPGRSVFLLDENGQQVPRGEIGEICVAAPYVRGYIHLPERTAETFRNGILHTGDLGRVDENGNYYIAGRKDDMIKINGNRVEPAEIETVFRSLSGLNSVIVKGFSEKDRSFLCLYYLQKEAEALPDFTVTDMKARMSGRLPYYMIPSYFVPLTEFPLNPNGKLDKKALKAPEAEDYRAEYVPPTNETERTLCDSFAKALALDRVGINDDFYLIGGDSMSAIAVITDCDMDGLSVTDLYQYHTPKQIAAALLERQNTAEDREEVLLNDRLQERVLLPEQLSILDDQLSRPHSTVWSVTGLLRLREGTNVDRFVSALNKAVRNHPAFATVISFNKESSLVQSYQPDILKPIGVTEISEDAFEGSLGSMVQPFRIFNSCLCDFRVYRTENSAYFFWNIHHIISDGTSLGLLFEEITASYHDPECCLEPDYYYTVLKEQELAEGSELFAKAEQYYRDNYEKRLLPETWLLRPREDLTGSGRTVSAVYKRIPETREDIAASACWKQIGYNGFCITALIIAQSIFNHEDHGAIQWIHNGRVDKHSMMSAGLLFRSMAVLVRDLSSISLSALLKEVHHQMDYSVSHYFYPYPYRSKAKLNESSVLLYQENIYSTGSLDEITEECPLTLATSDECESPFGMEIRDNADGAGWLVVMGYNNSRYSEAAMERMLSIYCSCLHEMALITSPDTVPVREVIERVLMNSGSAE